MPAVDRAALRLTHSLRKTLNEIEHELCILLISCRTNGHETLVLRNSCAGRPSKEVFEVEGIGRHMSLVTASMIPSGTQAMPANMSLGELIQLQGGKRDQLCIGFDPRAYEKHGLGDSLGTFSTLVNYTLGSGARFFFSPVRPGMHDVGDSFADLFGPPDVTAENFADLLAEAPRHNFAACKKFSAEGCKHPAEDLRVTTWQGATSAAPGPAAAAAAAARVPAVAGTVAVTVGATVAAAAAAGAKTAWAGEARAGMENTTTTTGSSSGADVDGTPETTTPPSTEAITASRGLRLDPRSASLPDPVATADAAAAAATPAGVSAPVGVAATAGVAAAAAATATAYAAAKLFAPFNWASCTAGVVVVTPGSEGHGLYYGTRHLYAGAAADLLRDRYHAARLLPLPPSQPPPWSLPRSLLLPGGDTGVSIAVHVRLGDVAETDPSRSGKRIDVECWQVNALALVLEAVRGDCARVFLFAESAKDHPDILAIKSRFPGVHFTFMGPEVAARAAFDAMVAADVLIASTSGFSGTAGALRPAGRPGIAVVPGCNRMPGFPRRDVEVVVPCSADPACALFGSAVTTSLREGAVAAVARSLEGHPRWSQCRAPGAAG
ncbi:unnamed protein product [Phaeothamnion confervicola]